MEKSDIFAVFLIILGLVLLGYEIYLFDMVFEALM